MGFTPQFAQLFSRRLKAAVYLSSILFSLVLLPNPAQALTVTPRIEYNIAPGETQTDTLRIQNEKRESKQLFVYFQNFRTIDESGNPIFSSKVEDLAAWIEAPSNISLGPGEVREIPISITVPGNAEVGGHFAAIFFSETPPEEEGKISVASSLGTLILLRVTGEFNESGVILEFGTKNKKRVQNSLPVTLSYRFQNTGDDHQRLRGDITIKNMFGGVSKLLRANPGDSSVLPKSIRRFESTWAKSGKPEEEPPNPDLPKVPTKFWPAVRYQMQNFAFGKYTATLEIVYGYAELKSTNETYSFFIIPWQLTTVALSILLLLIIFGRIAIKRYNRYIINKAMQVRRK